MARPSITHLASRIASNTLIAADTQTLALIHAALAAIIAFLAIPLFALFCGFTLKVLVMPFPILFAGVAFLWLYYGQIRSGVVRAGDLDLARLPQLGLITLLGKTFAKNVRFAAAILASEVALGFIAIFLPINENWWLTLLLALAGVGFLIWSIWDEASAETWKRIVITIIGGTAITTVLAMVYPSDAVLQDFLTTVSPWGWMEVAKHPNAFPYRGWFTRWAPIVHFVATAGVITLIIGFFAAKRRGGEKSGVKKKEGGRAKAFVTAFGAVALFEGLIFWFFGTRYPTPLIFWPILGGVFALLATDAKPEKRLGMAGVIAAFGIAFIFLTAFVDYSSGNNRSGKEWNLCRHCRP